MFGEDPRLNDLTHITPIHITLLKRLLAGSGLQLEHHECYCNASATTSRAIIRLIARLLSPLLIGLKGADHHIMVLRAAGDGLGGSAAGHSTGSER